MKEKTVYIAEDGRQFNTPKECVEYEHKCIVVNEQLRRLPKPPDNKNFLNGGGYIQHDAKIFEDVRKNINALSEKIIGSSSIRVMHESSISAICEAAYRFYRTDSSYREWGQPYFAMNPNKGQQIKLN